MMCGNCCHTWSRHGGRGHPSYRIQEQGLTLNEFIPKAEPETRWAVRRGASRQLQGDLPVPSKRKESNPTVWFRILTEEIECMQGVSMEKEVLKQGS